MGSTTKYFTCRVSRVLAVENDSNTIVDSKIAFKCFNVLLKWFLKVILYEPIYISFILNTDSSSTAWSQSSKNECKFTYDDSTLILPKVERLKLF